MIAQPEGDPQPQPLASEGGPTVLRIALGGHLRRLREANGISREAAGDAIRASHAKISRLELGRVGFKERDVSDLLTLYQVTDDEERERLVTLARRANEPGWWHQYGDLTPSWFETYLGLEQAANSIRTFATQFVPGLLQTPDYARAVVKLGHEPSAEIERRVELRIERQQVLHRQDRPPNLWAVIDESVLRRPVGGLSVMREQFHHLIKMAKRPDVIIQVLPYTAGGHAAAGGSFSMLRFDEPALPDIVYMEQLTSALYLDKREDIENYMAVMDKLSVQARQPEVTDKLLTSMLADLVRSTTNEQGREG